MLKSYLKHLPLLNEPVKVCFLHKNGVAYLMVTQSAALTQVINEVTLDSEIIHTVTCRKPYALYRHYLRLIHWLQDEDGW